MLKQLRISKELEFKRSALEKAKQTQAGLMLQREDLAKAIEEAENEEDLSLVEEQLNELETQMSEIDESIKELTENIESLKTELEKLNEEVKKSENKGESDLSKSARERINDAIKTRGNFELLDAETRSKFTTTEGETLLPVVVLNPEDKTDSQTNFRNLVTVIPVNTGNGKYPYMKKNQTAMNTVDELTKNPELANPTFTNVTFDIETYRGYIPVSQEIIDDSMTDVLSIIADNIQEQVISTENKAILTELKGFTAKTVTNVDELKDLFNTGIKKRYDVKAIVSASFYNELDKLKDKNGNYLLQPNVVTGTGKSLLGKEIVVVDDDEIGSQSGDKVGFIGDPKKAVTFFDRQKTAVKWIDNDIYGQLLAAHTRFDVVKTDEEAGFYVTFNPATTVPSV